METGYFVISLDFELLYGVLDKVSNNDDYIENIRGARRVIPQILKLFKQYSIAATWAVVGMLFNNNKDELLNNLPEKKPGYNNRNLSVYNQFSRITEANKDMFFAGDLIAQIADCPGQEIATHTYAHYYCTEAGQTKEEFEDDLKQAIRVMVAKGYEAPVSIIFPRNMCNYEYMDSLKKNGIFAYRGNARTWYGELKENIFKRAVRLLDGYINIGGNACYEIERAEVVNIPASRILYRFGKIPYMDALKIYRIKRQMRYAAIHKKVFHLWWHPHNFGVNSNKNLNNLIDILEYYRYLNIKYKMVSANLKTLGKEYCV